MADVDDNKIAYWWGLRCKNSDCGNEFRVRLGGGYPLFVAPPSDEETTIRAISEAMKAIEGIIRESAILNGLFPGVGATVNTTNLLQSCPDCGRIYCYSHGDFFLTRDPLPETTEEAN